MKLITGKRGRHKNSIFVAALKKFNNGKDELKIWGG